MSNSVFQYPVIAEAGTPPVCSECRCRMSTEPLRMTYDPLVPRSHNTSKVDDIQKGCLRGCYTQRVT
ncbi:hypothetical protein PGTUg99_025580 [Puccinia graminis f. sp. tritici]|uniref:Uncharacterized protein n=1 Tax=Puccinia graminis f. sp. tritici TaxID=56615 RepID=A0A5B0S770_PUCGR|nr:hypothetical protein PGTUg99_025580 [Puccinia graminis f. sp. tritici]